jgi:hypothetical protein
LNFGTLLKHPLAPQLGIDEHEFVVVSDAHGKNGQKELAPAVLHVKACDHYCVFEVLVGNGCFDNLLLLAFISMIFDIFFYEGEKIRCKIRSFFGV